MAIVKATYTRSREGAKASVRYIQQRPGKDREPITRTLFGRDGAMGRLEAYSFIDGADDGSFFYRFVVSPDPTEEDTKRDLDMQQLTYKTMQTLDQRLQTTLLWVAALHEEHAPHRHVHVIAAIPRRLTVKDFERLRLAATRESVRQRRALDLSAGRQDLGKESKTQQRFPTYQIPTQHITKYARSTHLSWHGARSAHVPRGVRPAHMHACTCPRCGATHVEYGKTHVHQCTCGFLLHKQQERSLQRKGGGWERSR